MCEIIKNIMIIRDAESVKHKEKLTEKGNVRASELSKLDVKKNQRIDKIYVPRSDNYYTKQSEQYLTIIPLSIKNGIEINDQYYQNNNSLGKAPNPQQISYPKINIKVLLLHLVIIILLMEYIYLIHVEVFFNC